MIRPIKAEEIEERRKKFKEKYPWAPEPQWEGVLVKVDSENQVVAMAELQYRVLVATCDGDTPRDTNEMMAALDGWLGGLGVHRYEFEVPEWNEKFNKFLQDNGIKPVERIPCRLYIMERYPKCQAEVVAVPQQPPLPPSQPEAEAVEVPASVTS